MKKVDKLYFRGDVYFCIMFACHLIFLSGSISTTLLFVSSHLSRKTLEELFEQGKLCGEYHNGVKAYKHMFWN